MAILYTAAASRPFFEGSFASSSHELRHSQPRLPSRPAIAIASSSSQDLDAAAGAAAAAAEEVPKLRPLRRRQRWQWSKGDGPGEYGGPPLDFRIRRMWGAPTKDPIVSTDDYIWNTDWQSHLIAPESKEPPAPAASEQEAGVGFLSLNRAIALDSIDVDLTQQLLNPVTSVPEVQAEALRDGRRTDEDKPRWRMAPTRREQKQWARARKAVPGGMAMLISEADEDQESPKKLSVAGRQNYLQLKYNLLLLTAVLGGAGAACAYVLYSAEVSVSYGVGLLGALVYIRMLSNSIDAFGKSDTKGAIRGALGQPRLLIPVVLVMLFNRWNEVLSPEYGFVHLQLIPILLGFFTYKAATVVEVFRDILQDS